MAEYPGGIDGDYDLSGPVKKALIRAQELAKEADNYDVGSEHILLALALEYPGPVERIVTSHSAHEIESQLRPRLSEDATANLEQVILQAQSLATEEGTKKIELRHLIKAAWQYTDYEGAKSEPSEPSVQQKPETTEQAKPTPTLDQLGWDMTASARSGEIHPIVGRDKELNQLIETLCRTFKRNPLLVGPAGVGKTAVVEGLALSITSGNVPRILKDKRLVSINMGPLIAGTMYRGQFEKRVTHVIKEASNPNIILFIDEIHSIVGAGRAEGAPMDAATMLMPALARGKISCIGATTYDEYHRHFAKNEALDRRFQTIPVDELPGPATVNVLETIAPTTLEKPNDLKIEEGVFEETVELAGRYLRNRYFPDKAIDVLDQAVGRAIREDRKVVNVSDVRNIVGSLTGLPVGEMEDALQRRLEGLQPYLKSRVMGQDHIIIPVVELIRPKIQGMDIRPERPNGVFLFVGPTGVGKTELARALAEYMFGSQHKFIKLDMSEYRGPDAPNKLLGSPFGYVGFERGSPFLDKIAENPFSILLLDEIEKAHTDIHNLFLQVFEDGVLTDAHGRHVYFSDVIIIMTSNISVGSKEAMGFRKTQIVSEARDELKGYFPPEFVNRIDFVGRFNRLPIEIARRIVGEKILPSVRKHWEKKGVRLEISQHAVNLLAERGFSSRWGGRQLERTVDEMLSSRLSRLLEEAKKEGGLTVKVGVRNGSLDIKKERRQ